jgi:hypothetical protein
MKRPRVPSCDLQVIRVEDEQTSQKDGCRNVPSTRSPVLQPTSCGQDFLDIQDSVSYTVSHRKQVLINLILSIIIDNEIIFR